LKGTITLATLTELVSEIVSAHASSTPMSKEELLAEIQAVYAVLSAMEKGEVVVAPLTAEEPVAEEESPAVSKRKAFGKDKIYCMICGKGFTTLKRHLNSAHELTPKEYRTKFNIPASTSLAAKAYSEARKQMAIEKNLGAGLAKARAARTIKK